MTCWWVRESTGKPFRLVRKMEMGTIQALIGSPYQRSKTSSDGRSAVSSITTPSRLLQSHNTRRLFHLQSTLLVEIQTRYLNNYVILACFKAYHCHVSSFVFDTSTSPSSVLFIGCDDPSSSIQDISSSADISGTRIQYWKLDEEILLNFRKRDWLK